MCAIEHYTYEDYVQWEGKWELIDGIPLAMAPSPMIGHQAIVVALSQQLFLESESCENCIAVVEQDWKINDETVVKPDAALICNEPHDAYITKTPRLVAEVVSPSSARRDEKTKFELYEKEGVPYYLLVYPDDLKAKAYALKEGCFVKLGDFTHETHRFEWSDCSMAIDFDRVFRRFRKER